MSSEIQQPGFRQFEFALTDALIAQLITCLDGMKTAELTPEITAGIPNGQGVYQLFLDGNLVYIGKTDNEAGLQRRLLRHANLVLSRSNLTGGRVTFKAVQVLVFSDGLSRTEVGKMAKCSAPSVTTNLQALKGERLVHQSASKQYFITSPGETTLAKFLSTETS